MGERRVTMADVASAAGVGIATVDRVLNGRAKVRRETAESVLEAASRIGYHAKGLIADRVAGAHPFCRLGFILQKESKAFYRTLGRAIEAAAGDRAGIRVSTDVSFVDALSPDDLSSRIGDMAGRVDALGVVSIDHPSVTSAIDSATEAGCHVFSMLSPLSAASVKGYIGIDGRKAGRTAGWLMRRYLSEGEVGILVGSHRYLGHEALEVGFRSYMREQAPDVLLKESLVYLDDAAVAYEAASELLRRAPDLSGLYQCGGGVRGVLKALQSGGRAGRIVYICHEINAASERALLDGTIAAAIATPIESVASRTIDAMLLAVQGKQQKPIGALDFSIVTPENV